LANKKLTNLQSRRFIIKNFFRLEGRVHAHGGTVELIKLRIMSDKSIARGQAMLCEIFGKGIKDKEKKT